MMVRLFLAEKELQDCLDVSGSIASVAYMQQGLFFSDYH